MLKNQGTPNHAKLLHFSDEYQRKQVGKIGFLGSLFHTNNFNATSLGKGCPTVTTVTQSLLMNIHYLTMVVRVSVIRKRNGTSLSYKNPCLQTFYKPVGKLG